MSIETECEPLFQCNALPLKTWNITQKPEEQQHHQEGRRLQRRKVWGILFQLSAVGRVVVASGTNVAVNLSTILLCVRDTAGSLAVPHHLRLTLIQTFK